MRTPRPISHRARSVGRSPFDPHGQPLSTRSASGKPHATNQSRRDSRISSRETLLQYPEGKNAGRQNGSRVFVDDPQPAHAPTHSQRDLLGRVHLPNLVCPLRPARLGFRLPARRRRRMFSRCQPALHSPHGRCMIRLPRDKHPDQPRAPRRMLPPQLLDQILLPLPLRRQRARPDRIRRPNARLAAFDKPRDQTPHGPGRHRHLIRDLRHRPPLSPQPINAFTHWNRDRPRHDTPP
jgi:hypothetical protein